MGAAPDLPLSKPNRSEIEALDPHEQRWITEQVRLKFEADAPRRHPKPCRSEPSSSSSVVQGVAEDTVSPTAIPEFLKFQALIQTQPLIFPECQNFDSEEFVETDYYKDLNAVDKTLHHMTGSGFIQVKTSLIPDDTSIISKLELSRPPHMFVRTKSHCNPATNDWIPSPPHVWS